MGGINMALLVSVTINTVCNAHGLPSTMNFFQEGLLCTENVRQNLPLPEGSSEKEMPRRMNMKQLVYFA
jgi:hypothetical protein